MHSANPETQKSSSIGTVDSGGRWGRFCLSNAQMPDMGNLKRRGEYCSAKPKDSRSGRVWNRSLVCEREAVSASFGRFANMCTARQFTRRQRSLN
jgi:hypothetical protein